MELPVSPTSYQPDAQALWRVVCDGYVTLARTSAQQTMLDAAELYIHPDRPGVRLVNMAQFDPRSSLMDAKNFDRQLQAVMDACAQAGGVCETIYWREQDAPAWADAAMASQGYAKHLRTVLMLQAYRQVEDAPDEALQIVPARAVYPKLLAYFRHQAKVEYKADDAMARHLAQAWLDCLDEPGLELLVAMMQGQLVASAGVLGMGRHGLLWPGWCDPAWRKRGIARKLMHQVIAFCSRATFSHVLLDRAADCWSIPFYQSLGMKPAAAGVKYKRRSVVE